MTRLPHRMSVPNVPKGLSADAAVVYKHSLDVFAAFSKGDASSASAPIAELERLLPGDPRVSQYKKTRAAIAFKWSAARGDYSPQVTRDLSPNQIDLVAFHVDMQRAPSLLHDKINYLEILAGSFRLAARTAPDAKRILITDMNTSVPGSLDVHEIRRMDIDHEFLMYERMRCQLEYLKERPQGRCSVLMDVDVVVNRDPVAIFLEDFDFGLTYRVESKDAPFNGGVLFAGPGDGGATFLGMALQCYQALTLDNELQAFHDARLGAWWGDQFALYATVGQEQFWLRASEGITVSGLKIAFFPSSEYNFTYDSQTSKRELLTKYFLHFKGNRKGELMGFTDEILRTLS